MSQLLSRLTAALGTGEWSCDDWRVEVLSYEQTVTLWRRSSVVNGSQVSNTARVQVVDVVGRLQVCKCEARNGENSRKCLMSFQSASL